jgi:adenosylcobinamide kinase / adenosylcobinamide-phosphate guanylyltransferase
MALTVLTGPVSSGKSRLAAELASDWTGQVETIVTAEALDAEMASRIERHRSSRPAAWRVHEEPLELTRSIGSLDEGSFAIVDCLTVWASNRLGAGDTGERVVELAHEAAAAAAGRSRPTVVVTNEVGWGIVPMNELARSYRDVLGRVNAAFVARSARAWLVVAGRALPLVRPDAEELLA